MYDLNTSEPAALSLHKEAIHALPLAAALRFYDEIIKIDDRETLRWMCKNDRYFLLTCVIGRADMVNDWCFDRCREVEASPDGWLDLWSRGHYKSTIITFAGTIQEILKDPNITVGILSYNGATADAFVSQIKDALEMPALIQLFPDILWEKPPREQWGIQKGLWVKRTTTVKEPTVMGGGLIDAQPIGFHFMLRIYDDVVTDVATNTPEQILKVTNAWALSSNLRAGDESRVWMVGTRYHPMDTYAEVIKRGAAKERRRIGEDAEGRPLLFTPETLAETKKTMGERIFAAQFRQQPTGVGVRMFRDEWLQYYDRAPERRKLNVYILIDSANAKRKGNDYTTMWVIGLGSDDNYYVLDVIRDRMNLVERTQALIDLHKQWHPLCVYWEQVGAMSDTQHVRDIMERDNYRFVIRDLPQRIPKLDRIGWLIPLFEAGRIWLPRRLLRPTVSGDTHDFIQDFITDEYSICPVLSHDDMLDCLANIKHEGCSGMKFPKPQDEEQSKGGQSNSKWDPYA